MMFRMGNAPTGVAATNGSTSTLHESLLRARTIISCCAASESEPAGRGPKSTNSLVHSSARSPARRYSSGGSSRIDCAAQVWARSSSANANREAGLQRWRRTCGPRTPLPGPADPVSDPPRLGCDRHCASGIATTNRCRPLEPDGLLSTGWPPRRLRLLAVPRVGPQVSEQHRSRS